MKFKFDLKSIRKFLQGFLPFKYILVVCILFYVLGIVFAFMNPDWARLTFPGGFFLNNIDVKIQLPQIITLNYLVNQFVYYLGSVSFHYFLNNVSMAILCIFTGILIFPKILIGIFLNMGVVTFFLTEKHGFITGLLVLLGSFHLYFEILAALLAIDAFFKFYIPFINSIRQHDITIFKKGFLNEFIPLFIRILILLAIASILEVFWSTWWIYILTHPYISWHDFYFGAYSVIVN